MYRHRTLQISGSFTALLVLIAAAAPAAPAADTDSAPAPPEEQILPMPPADPFETENMVVILLGGVRQQECLDAEDYGDCYRLGNDVRPNAVWFKNMLNTTRTGQQTGRAMIATGQRLGMRGGPNAADVPSLHAVTEP